jgi:hypothetical protein
MKLTANKLRYIFGALHGQLSQHSVCEFIAKVQCRQPCLSVCLVLYFGAIILLRTITVNTIFIESYVNDKIRTQKKFWTKEKCRCLLQN